MMITWFSPEDNYTVDSCVFSMLELERSTKMEQTDSVAESVAGPVVMNGNETRVSCDR